MHKLSISAFVVMIIIAGIGFYTYESRMSQNTGDENKSIPEQVSEKKNSDPKSISYEIDGITYTLVDGKAEVKSTADTVSVNSLSMFGEPIKGDLDADGDSDAAVLLALTSGGSGTFYYAVLAINSNGEYRSTNALFLGDRIAPQTIEIRDGRALYNYAERRVDEPMGTQPSIGKSFWIQLDSKKNEIGEYVQNFEGEVSADALKLDAHPWVWVRTDYADEPAFVSKHASSFILTFDGQNHFSSKTDCNGVGGDYTKTNATMTFANMMSTLMYCDGSDEQTYTAMLSDIGSYSFGRRGELLLENKMGNGTMLFQ